MMNKDELINYLICENENFSEEEFFSHKNRRALIFISPMQTFKLNVPNNSSHTEMLISIYNLLYNENISNDVSYMDLRKNIIPSRNIVSIDLTSDSVSELILPNKINEEQLENLISENKILKKYNKSYLYYNSSNDDLYNSLDDGILECANRIDSVNDDEYIVGKGIRL